MAVAGFSHSLGDAWLLRHLRGLVDLSERDVQHSIWHLWMDGALLFFTIWFRSLWRHGEFVFGE